MSSFYRHLGVSLQPDFFIFTRHTWRLAVAEWRKVTLSTAFRLAKLHLVSMTSMSLTSPHTLRHPGVGGCEAAVSWSRPGTWRFSGGGLKVRSPGQRHHQQHVLWDSDACRPSLKPFPVAAPAASTAGIRLPEETHKQVFIQFHFCTWLFLLVVTKNNTQITCLHYVMIICIFAPVTFSATQSELVLNRWCVDKCYALVLNF